MKIKMKNADTIRERIDRHDNICRIQNFPNFAPFDGICWSCRGQIFHVYTGEGPITGCPYCHRSYCD